MKSYSVYIFDLDGTITDTTQVWLDLIRETLLKFGVTAPEDKILAKYTHDWKEMIKLGLPLEKLDEFTKLNHRVANERLPKAPLHDGAYEVLSKLRKKGKRVGIFSTLDRPMFEPAMEFRNLYAVSEASIAGTDVPHRKPHPAGILKTLEDLGIPQSEFVDAVYIGDKATDIQAAQNAGIDSILYYPPLHAAIYDRGELEKLNPTYVIEDWKELTV